MGDDMLSSEQISLVRASWQQVMPISETAAVLFYDRLFELDPSLRPMFAHSDMAEQRRKLMQTLAVVVAGLGRIEELLPAVQALGRRHVGYGVRDEHYAVVGEALLWTLGKGLGDGFTDDVRAAWLAAYMLLAGVMQQAAREVEAAAA